MCCAIVDGLCPKYLFASSFLSSCYGCTVTPSNPHPNPLNSQSDSFREPTVIMWTLDIT